MQANYKSIDTPSPKQQSGGRKKALAIVAGARVKSTPGEGWVAFVAATTWAIRRLGPRDDPAREP